MEDKTPKIKDDEMYQLLRREKISLFNAKRAEGGKFDLTWADFRGLDLRGMDATGIDFSNSYFRLTDLRGVDLSTCRLEGATIKGAHISGTFFPIELSPDEILLSLLHGTRLRYKT